MSSSNPPPLITWVDDLNQTVPNIGTRFLYLESGRYLAIIGVDLVTAQRVFHCRVTNVFGMLSVDSPTRYRFSTSGKLILFLSSTYDEVCPILSPASPGTGLVIYKPLQDVNAYEGDTNVQFSMVVADGGGSVSLTYIITSVPAGSSLQTAALPTQPAVAGIISGPVTLVDSGTVVTCRVFSSAGVKLYTAALTVLGE